MPTPTHCTPKPHTTHKRTTHNTQHARWHRVQLGRFERTHGGEVEGHRQFCLPKFAHVGLSLDRRGSPKKPLDLTRFQCEKRSRTTCSRFLQSFALPGKAVEFQFSLGTLRKELATGWFDLSFATKTQVLRTICTSDTFHDVRLKKPLTCHNGFMFFATSLNIYIYIYVFISRQGRKNIRNGIVWVQTSHSTCTCTDSLHVSTQKIRIVQKKIATTKFEFESAK